MSDAAQPLPLSHLDLANTYGAFFIGLVITSVLFGIATLQVFIYVTTFDRDWVWTKTSVYALWLLDAFHLALICHVMYFYLVSNFANPLDLMYIVWSYKVKIILDVVVVMLVQTLYIIRLIKLNAGEYKIVPWIGAGLMCVAYGVGITQSWAILTVHIFTEVHAKIGWSIYMTLGCATVVDTVIAAFLCFTLARRRTGFAKTDTTVDRLIIYIVNTGLLTSICSITTIVMYIAMPNNFIFLAMGFFETKLYINSYMAMLNARRRRRGRSSAYIPQEIELSAHEDSVITSKVQPMSPYHPNRVINLYPISRPRFDGEKLDNSDEGPLGDSVVEVAVQRETLTRVI